MKPAALLLALFCAFCAWAAPAHAQRTTHWRGGGGFSPDGSLLAFYVQGRPATEIVVLQVASGQSYLLELAAPHVQIEDLTWAQSSNTLMFVSLDPGAVESFLPDPNIIDGYGTHIWSIAFTADGPQPARVIAQGHGLRWPALSPDESKVAYFEPVLLPSEVSRRKFISTWAYAVFERDIAKGEIVRVAESQYDTPRALYYEGGDSWLFSADDARYPQKMGDREFWGSRPAPPGSGTFDQLTNGINSFRMLRGEVLPQYPGHVRPYPENAPPGSSLTGMTQDGRAILFGAPDNSAARQQLRALLGNVPELQTPDAKEGFMALKADGSHDMFVRPEPPGDFHWDRGGANTGGAGVDAALKLYFTIQKKYDASSGTDDNFLTSRLFLYEGQTLVLERDIPDVIAKSMTVRVAE